MNKLQSWLKTAKERGTPSAPPTDLHAYLCSSAVNVKDDLDPELRRRGLKVSGVKNDKATAIVKHVLENPDHYILAEETEGKPKGEKMPWAPCGFTGDRPSKAPED